MHPRAFPLLVLAALLPAALSAASVTGRVTLPKSSAPPVQNKRYDVVAKNGVLSTNPPLAVVYLEGTFPADSARPVAQVAQKDMVFVPMLLPVRTGTTVEFPNGDNLYHNIFSYSPAKRFDLGRYRREEKPVPTVLFDTPGLVVLRCDIHEHMRGLILVLDTPHFVVTDTEGRYELKDVPPGHYTLKVWLDSRTTLARSVDIPDGAALRLDFP